MNWVWARSDLITNNPVKRAGLEGYGITIVNNIPLNIPPNEHNHFYLKTKKNKMGHLLELLEDKDFKIDQRRVEMKPFSPGNCVSWVHLNLRWNHLKAIIEAGYPVKGVITSPDKPSGRGLQMHPSPVKIFALQHNLPVLQPLKLKDPEFLEALRHLAG